MPVLHQVIPAAARGDAVSDHAFLLRGWLRALGFRSEIFAEHIARDLRREVRSVDAYRPAPGETHVVYHHCIGSRVVNVLAGQPVRLLLIYHNITPPQFFEAANPEWAQHMRSGRAQLQDLLAQTDLALGDSEFNTEELRAGGFPRTGVLPITLEPARYDGLSDPALAAQLAGAGPRLLFVGRQVPNKKPEDLYKLLYFYRRLRPEARLLLVGQAASWLPDYMHDLEGLLDELDLRAAVHLAGHVTQAQLATYYRSADLYISMSEHEGFGKPLMESLYLGLPVLAYAAAAVPGTLGGAGVLFHHKNFEALAEVVDVLVTDQALRARLIARGRARARDFLEPAVRAQWARYLADVGLWPAEAAPRPAEVTP